MADEAFDIRVGGRYRHYDVDQLLGRGGMSIVFRAQHALTGRVVAIKVLRSTPETRDADRLLERFRREASLLCAVDHPNLPTIYEMDVVQGTPVIVMEYLQGRDLRRVLDERRRLGVREALWVATEVTRPLAVLHAKGIVHRDLTPQNVFVTDEETPQKRRVRVTDFGIAYQKGARGLTSKDLMVGTLNYIAPEYLMGSPDLDGRADQYSLGCLLYEMLDGLPLFIRQAGAMPRGVVLCHWHCSQPVPDLRSAQPDVPLALWRIVQRLLAKAPDQRFESTEALLEALTEVQQAERERGPSGPSSSRLAPLDEPVSSHRPLDEPVSSHRPLAEPVSSHRPLAEPVVATAELPTSAEAAARRALAALPATVAMGRKSGEPAGAGTVELERGSLEAPASEVPSTAEMPREQLSRLLTASRVAASVPGTLELPRTPLVARAPVVVGTLEASAAQSSHDAHPGVTGPTAGALPYASTTSAEQVRDLESLRRWLSTKANAHLRELGCDHMEAARTALEEALFAADVMLRTAAASELSMLGDYRSLPSLQALRQRETVPMVLLVLDESIALLSGLPAVDRATGVSSPRPTHARHRPPSDRLRRAEAAARSAAPASEATAAPSPSPPAAAAPRSSAAPGAASQGARAATSRPASKTPPAAASGPSSSAPSAAAATSTPIPTATTPSSAEPVASPAIALRCGREAIGLALADGQEVWLGIEQGAGGATALVRLRRAADELVVLDELPGASQISHGREVQKTTREREGRLELGAALEVLAPGERYRLTFDLLGDAEHPIRTLGPGARLWLDDLAAAREPAAPLAPASRDAAPTTRPTTGPLASALAALAFRHPSLLVTVVVWLLVTAAVLGAVMAGRAVLGATPHREPHLRRADLASASACAPDLAAPRCTIMTSFPRRAVRHHHDVLSSPRREAPS